MKGLVGRASLTEGSARAAKSYKAKVDITPFLVTGNLPATPQEPPNQARSTEKLP